MTPSPEPLTPADREKAREPGLLDLCFTIFMAAHAPNKEDGGPSDWMNDTKPLAERLIASLGIEARVVELEAALKAAAAEIAKLKREANTDNISDRLDKLGLRFAVEVSHYIPLTEDFTYQIQHIRKEFQEAAFDAFCDLALPYRKRAESAEARATALLEALATAIKVAGEAREEWDKAPSGMKAGKLLIALSDPSLKYRSDITAMHATYGALNDQT